MKVGIVNVTGYAGVELARLLLNHKEVKITQVTGRSAAGKKLSDIFPHLLNNDLDILPKIEEKVDLAFIALPHKESALQAIPLLEEGIKVIDISADFRLKNHQLYDEWYNFTHPSPDHLNQAVYGLPEIYYDQIIKAKLVANPGCYPTSAILALAPALSFDLIEDEIIIDSKSGVSGAGRTLSMSSHYCEINENCHAYALAGHRHLPEIVQELNAVSEINGFVHYGKSADDFMIFEKILGAL